MQIDTCVVRGDTIEGVGYRQTPVWLGGHYRGGGDRQTPVWVGGHYRGCGVWTETCVVRGTL